MTWAARVSEGVTSLGSVAQTCEDESEPARCVNTERALTLSSAITEGGLR